MSHLTRRRFLEDSLLASAALAAAGSASTVLAAEEAPQSKSPNEKLLVAVVGVRGRGGSHIAAFAGRKDTEIAYLVDVDEVVGESRAEEVEKRQGRRPKVVKDMREAFEDKSIDIVSTATPNHWHSLCAIWAMQAGKDVYCEKPVSHNVSEGRRMVEAARKYDRICQTGTQSRSNPGMREIMEYIHSGKLGEVKLARGLCYKPRGSIGAKGTYDVPKSVDYNLWCGPAPMNPLTRPQFHYDWHWMWDYGNGDLGNQGIHQMDLARWALNVNDLGQGVVSYGGRFGYEDAGETANTQVNIHKYGDKNLVFEVRGLKTDDYKGAKVGLIVYGSEGYAVIPSYDGGVVFDKNGQQVQTSFTKGGGDDNHFGNFLTAVRSRKKEDLNADILEGHLSSALCHLGNISYRLGQTIPVAEATSRLEANDETRETFARFKDHLSQNDVNLDKTQVQFGKMLAVDSKTETLGEESANAMLTRQYRAPFVVPAADQI
ncbi:MAG: Gfo/Idh/MocA family protein [Pirellulales bacterium]